LMGGCNGNPGNGKHLVDEVEEDDEEEVDCG